MSVEYDAVVVGAGPNGLTAGVLLARAGRSVLVVEGADTIGGGTRTEELTLPGFHHDVCSAVHPFGATSPVLRTLPLEEHGLRWVHPDIPLAHGIDPSRISVLPRDLDEATEILGRNYAARIGPMVEHWAGIEQHLLGPIPRLPRHPLALARFGLEAIRPATTTARALGPIVGPLFAGCAAHAFLPLDRPLTASFGWVLMASAHVHGWPFAAGGSRAITDSLASLLRSLGGEIRTGTMVHDLDELPPSKLTFLDVTPSGFANMAGARLPSDYLTRAERFRHGPAAYKIDYALSAPMPWRSPELARAGTIHLSGTAEEVASAERAAFEGRRHPRPFILVVQQSMFDETRAPEGAQTLWVYAHVPHASTGDHSEQIETRLEEFAPGFADVVLERHVMSPAAFESYNPNFVGGDIAGGAHTIDQLVFRPFPQTNPYATPIDGVYLCSASTPPGAGAHGMCGYHAVRSAIGDDVDTG